MHRQSAITKNFTPDDDGDIKNEDQPSSANPTVPHPTKPSARVQLDDTKPTNATAPPEQNKPSVATATTNKPSPRKNQFTMAKTREHDPHPTPRSPSQDQNQDDERIHLAKYIISYGARDTHSTKTPLKKVNRRKNGIISLPDKKDDLDRTSKNNPSLDTTLQPHDKGANADSIPPKGGNPSKQNIDTVDCGRGFVNFPQGPRPTILFTPNTTPSPEQQDMQSVSSKSCDHNSRVVKRSPPTTPFELPAAANAHTNNKFKCMTDLPLEIDAGNNPTIESNRGMKPFITSPHVECSHTPLQKTKICSIRKPTNKASFYWSSSNQKET